MALTDGGVVKATIVAALQAPLAITQLHAHDGHWTLTRTSAALPRLV